MVESARLQPATRIGAAHCGNVKVYLIYGFLYKMRTVATR